MSDATPNQEFIDVWNTILAPKFTRFRRVFVDQAQKHSDVALERHPPKKGDRVLDVGCGFGETSIQIAKLVDPGQVIGLDPARDFVATGRADAAAAGVRNVSFVCEDAQTWRDPEPFDLVFARFGIMFFAQPVVALRNLRAQLRPGGRVLFVVWRTLEENTGFAIAKATARRFLPPPPDDGQKCGPGPFSMADPETARAQHAAAGFVDVDISPINVTGTFGATLDDAMDIALSLGPAGEIVREAGALGQELLPRITDALREGFAPYVRPGAVDMPMASWCISARNP
jgi:ubiquinone/menaquinone biosynthesis C-methylase UbiE